jgi:hypothetical protein
MRRCAVLADSGGRAAQTGRAIPFGFTTLPGEIWRTPSSWVEASYPNVSYFSQVGKGGDFAAWEEPELFSSELREAFGSLAEQARVSGAHRCEPLTAR